MQRWRNRLGEIPSTARLAAWQDIGFRLIIPGDAEWPTQLDDLGDTRPIVLWLHGSADPRMACVNSVAIVGSRAATAIFGTSAFPDSEKLDNRGILPELSFHNFWSPFTRVLHDSYGIDKLPDDDWGRLTGCMTTDGETGRVLAGSGQLAGEACPCL